MKGRFNYFFIVSIIFLSCTKEKRYQDYNENDFYEVQGVVTKAYQTSSIFDSSYNRLMNYTYAINDSIFLEGKEKEFYKAWEFGQPIIVLVHRKDSTISFYARSGILNSLTEKQIETFNTILEIDRIKN
ncbi:hypothetical protein [uncultured Tenacibaculum sp.]|uniref:hypothetical protein n=1 Tax=uncultured Tenacibaculum sp. TaxID=174713 RepID=UPI002618D6F8|nr:hypothetical protein [uncultured Tenacibaculum sp.]